MRLLCHMSHPRTNQSKWYSSRFISFIHPITINSFFQPDSAPKRAHQFIADSLSLTHLQLPKSLLTVWKTTMGHIPRCKLFLKDHIHPELWVVANRKCRAVPQRPAYSCRIQQGKQGSTLYFAASRHPDLNLFIVQQRTESEQTRTDKRLLKRQNEGKRKLPMEQAGIKYDFEVISYVRFFLVLNTFLKANYIY
jgi:hypothetical protein